MAPTGGQRYNLLQTDGRHIASWELNYRISNMSQKCDFEVLSEKYGAFKCPPVTFYLIFLSCLIGSPWHILGVKLSYLHAITIVSP